MKHMKKIISLTALLLALALLLTSCKAPEPVEPEPEPTEIPTPAPTEVIVTPEPTISPRPMEGVEWPEGNATMITIDPIDKPTAPPIVFEPYRTYVSPNLGVSFDIPAYFGEPTGEMPNSQQIVFTEPYDNIRSGLGVATTFTVSVDVMGNDQTEQDASVSLEAFTDRLAEEFESLEISRQDSNTIMGQKGRYVTYWLDMPIDVNNPDAGTIRMRGRIVVIPSGKRLYNIRYLCPLDRYSEYDEHLFKKVRSSFKEV